MNHQIRALGLTLVELMAVVAIIALLAGIGGFYVMDNRPNRARADLRNDVETLLHTQRMRATSMNVATYVRFENQTGTKGFKRIVPRIGDLAICVQEADNQYSIRYELNNANESNQVAIDLREGVGEGGNVWRTLDSKSSSKYASNTPIVGIEAIFTGVDESGTFQELQPATVVICFQPNGEVVFIEDENERDWIRQARMEIFAEHNGSQTPERFFIEVTSLGAISSGRVEL